LAHACGILPIVPLAPPSTPRVTLATASAACLVAGAVACARAPLVLTPTGPASPTCPSDGCDANAWPAPSHDYGALCSGTGEAACGGAPAAECTGRALSLWSDAADDRTVACVARMLSAACSLDDARACGFAGRLSLDGRGVTRDVRRGLGMLVRACDADVVVACAAAIRWLDDPHTGDDAPPDASDLRIHLDAQLGCATDHADACYTVGTLFYTGHGGFPRDRASSARAYGRGCDLGDSRACNNFADALAYGEGVERDLERAAQTFEKSCHQGESLGCANLAYRAEHGLGVPRDRVKARALYRDACATGEPYGCMHAEMLAAEDAGAPRDPPKALAHWVRRCAAGDGRACAFAGLIYDDGPDGLTRDAVKSHEAMTRACALAEARACQWTKGRSGD
jgi:TPR repeat protein